MNFGGALFHVKLTSARQIFIDLELFSSSLFYFHILLLLFLRLTVLAGSVRHPVRYTIWLNDTITTVTSATTVISYYCYHHNTWRKWGRCDNIERYVLCGLLFIS
jgi:hypothetical protein